jgi:D-alanyl-D-alanine carboxypeptidase (penicillin-binding protein 5/6)
MVLKKKLVKIVMVLLLISLSTSVTTRGQVSQAAQDASQKGAPAESISTGLETTAESAILLEPVTNKIIYKKEPHKKLSMASVTKLMTLLLATEAVERGEFKLSDKVVTSENAWAMGGSQIYLEPGEEMSLWDMLLAIGLQSANDASVAIAEHIMGTHESFVQAMNDRVKSLGLQDTNFVNCHGLTADNHYTSAYDMAIILKEGLKNPLFRKITAMKEYDLRGGTFKLWNTNKLLWWYNGADAGKTGWTEAAKYCLATSAERDGLRLICVVMGTAEPKSHFREATKFFNYGFARYQAINIAPAGYAAGKVKVGKGQSDSVEALTADKVSIVVQRGEDREFESKIALPDYINAPVRKGQDLGWYVVVKDDSEVLKVKLIAKEDVAKATVLGQIKKVIDNVF